MNVALFASAYYPHVGGVEELVRQLAHALRGDGHGAIVLTNRWPRDLPEAEMHEDIPVYRLPMRTPEGSPWAPATYAATHRDVQRRIGAVLRRHRADVVHVQCVSANGHYAGIASRALGLPLIVTAQGELTMDASGLYQRSRFMQSALHRLLDRADAVTGCSGQTIDELQRWHGRAFRRSGVAISNGIRLDDFAKGKPYAHPRPYVLGIGRLVPQKGFDVLIDAFNRAGLPEHDLLIAGEGPEHERLERLAEAPEARGRARLVGRADREAAVSLFLGADLFVLPSRHEPFGIVNIEAMAAGKAVVATRVGGVPEIVTDGENGLLVPPDDPQAMASAIRRVASDPKLRARLAANGLERARRFDWQDIVRQYVDIYRQALAGHA